MRFGIGTEGDRGWESVRYAKKMLYLAVEQFVLQEVRRTT